MILWAKGLEKWIGERLLFRLQELSLYPGDRIGLVGLNGAGKTTLLRTLAGELAPDAGTVRQLGSLAIVHQMDEEDGLSPAVESAGKWRVGAGISGGERVRKRIAAALEKKPDILFMDEPTANLDLEGTLQLEQALLRHSGALVIISHDRELLDNVCTQILELEDGCIHTYAGGFSDYWAQKKLAFDQQMAAYEQNEKKRRQLEAAAAGQDRKANKVQNLTQNDYSRGRAKKVAQKASAMRTRIEKLPDVQKPKETGRVWVDFQVSDQPVSRFPVRGQGITLSIGGKTLLKDSAFSLARGTHTALTGPNGSGKTTLMRAIVEGMPGITVSPDVRLGYFSQALDGLNDSLSILENIRLDSAHTPDFIRLVLARLWIRGENVHKRVGNLSGGERVKVALAKVYLSRANVLLLDEPTNYLDLYSLTALEEAFADWPGTMLFVSHDRRFRRRVADRELAIEDCKLVVPQEKVQAQSPKQADRLLLEMEKARLLAQLSTAKEEDKPALDAAFQAVIAQLREMGQQ